MRLLPPLEPQDSMLAGMSYPFWFVVSPYLLMGEKKSEPFVRFHAIQAVVIGGVQTVITLLMLITAILLFRTAPTVPTAPSSSVEISSKALAEETDTVNIDVRNNSYMVQGCFSIGVFSAITLIICIEFCFTLFCGWRAWNGQFYSIPFIGKFVEDKYFQDFIE